MNHKYGGCGVERIFCNFIGFTNHKDAVVLQLDDGRFWIYEILAKRQAPSYYTMLFNWLKTDGPAHLELWIRNRDIKSFEYAAPPPDTEAKRVMVDASRGAMEQLVRDSIEDHTGMFQCDILDANLVKAYVQLHMDQDRLSQHDINDINKIFHSVSEKLVQERYRVPLDATGSQKNKRYRLRAIRNAEQWRAKSPNAIAEEYKRAWMIAAGRDVGAPLKEVKER